MPGAEAASRARGRPAPPGRGSSGWGGGRHSRGSRTHGRRVRREPTSCGGRRDLDRGPPTQRPGGRTRAGPSLLSSCAGPIPGVPALPQLQVSGRRRHSSCQPGSTGVGSRLRGDAGPRGPRSHPRRGAARRGGAGGPARCRQESPGRSRVCRKLGKVDEKVLVTLRL